MLQIHVLLHLKIQHAKKNQIIALRNAGLWHCSAALNEAASNNHNYFRNDLMIAFAKLL